VRFAPAAVGDDGLVARDEDLVHLAKTSLARGLCLDVGRVLSADDSIEKALQATEQQRQRTETKRPPTDRPVSNAATAGERRPWARNSRNWRK